MEVSEEQKGFWGLNSLKKIEPELEKSHSYNKNSVDEIIIHNLGWLWGPEVPIRTEPKQKYWNRQ